MRILRLIRGVTKRDRLRNDDIRREFGITSVLELIERNKLRWYGHIQRMDEEKYPKRILNHIPEGTRPVGRPRRRWIEGVDEALNRRGTNLDEVSRNQIFMDRTEWRRIVNEAPAADRL